MLTCTFLSNLFELPRETAEMPNYFFKRQTCLIIYFIGRAGLVVWYLASGAQGPAGLIPDRATLS